MCISWMIPPPCEITDQLAVGTQNCFSTLFYTPYTNIKTSAQNASKCTIARQKNQKISWGGGGTTPSPDPSPGGDPRGGYPSPVGEGVSPSPTGDTPPQTPPPPRFLRLRRSAFPFLFIYDSNTGPIHVFPGTPLGI